MNCIEIFLALVGSIALFISCISHFILSFGEETYGEFDDITVLNLFFLSLAIAVFGFWVAWQYFISITMLKIIIVLQRALDPKVNLAANE